MGLQGTISSHVGNLSFLQVLDLRNNSFHGHLTDEVGRLHRLTSLMLMDNTLEEGIPMGLHRCRMLRAVSLAGNNFSGSIPKELSTLPFLRYLVLAENNLTGVDEYVSSNVNGEVQPIDDPRIEEEEDDLADVVADVVEDKNELAEGDLPTSNKERGEVEAIGSLMENSLVEQTEECIGKSNEVAISKTAVGIGKAIKDGTREAETMMKEKEGL
ncbi:LRR receptor-like serine/threonine-protein kinase EFR [Camellia lanceoleosa]|uniref:LRR receptor-like serine/threonine-protein kinase EFR n=1 Tax=Camellia lanceoleosa TaxID=1840588 RepID=A0ACC0I2B7_9ERIC|nr:LRR receptor-like serine/threonine-protein kinase EFR [Camellia lanceoleosa]